MKLLNIIMIFAVLLLIAGCIPKPGSDSGFLNLPGSSDEELDEKEQMVKELEDKYGDLKDMDAADIEDLTMAESLGLQDNEYYFKAGDSKTIGNIKVTVLSIESGPKVEIKIGSIPLRLVETKSDEIANKIVVALQKFNFKLKDSPENYVVLKLTPLELGDDEYLLTEKDTVDFTDKVFTFNEARSDGSIYFDIDPSRYTNERIVAGASKEFEGLEISPVQTFTKDSTRDNYAIVKIVEL